MAFDREAGATIVAPGARAGAPAGEPAISVTGLVKSFGAVRALDGVHLEVAPGTVLGLLGPNGAGKTTIVRMLTTLLEPDAGTARVAGLDVVGDARALRHRIVVARRDEPHDAEAHRLVQHAGARVEPVARERRRV